MTSNPWQTEVDTEAEDTEKTPPDIKRLEIQSKAVVILEESGSETWGTAVWVRSTFSDEPGEVVGTWSKSPMLGDYIVFLETPISALQDRAVQVHLDLVKKRQEGQLAAKTTPKSRKAKAPVEPSVDTVRVQSKIDSIRASLSK